MSEPLVLDDAFWDKVTREPPPILELMQMVWQGALPPVMTEDYLRTQKLLHDDPKGFQAQLVGLEKGYQAQVLEANKRDRRIRELEGKVAALEQQLRQVVSRPEEEVAIDPETGKVLDLIDKLRKQFEVERAG